MRKRINVNLLELSERRLLKSIDNFLKNHDLPEDTVRQLGYVDSDLVLLVDESKFTPTVSESFKALLYRFHKKV